mmetsp:Transcript_20441/g.41207  ORF Transcript_20441/g.41207 Transcript_20441/m.41207 type:complete len:156 (+) Transcript_20441:182-649(+)
MECHVPAQRTNSLASLISRPRRYLCVAVCIGLALVMVQAFSVPRETLGSAVLAPNLRPAAPAVVRPKTHIGQSRGPAMRNRRGMSRRDVMDAGMSAMRRSAAQQEEASRKTKVHATRGESLSTLDLDLVENQIMELSKNNPRLTRSRNLPVFLDV